MGQEKLNSGYATLLQGVLRPFSVNLMKEKRKRKKRTNTAQAMAYSGSCKVSRQFQTVKKVTDCQDSCRLLRLMQTVKTTADSYRMSKHLHMVLDHADMFVLGCLVKGM